MSAALVQPCPSLAIVDKLDRAFGNAKLLAYGRTGLGAVRAQLANVVHLLCGQFGTAAPFTSVGGAVQHAISLVLRWRGPTQVARIDASAIAAVVRRMVPRGWWFTVDFDANQTVNHSHAAALGQVDNAITEALSERPDQAIVSRIGERNSIEEAPALTFDPPTERIAMCSPAPIVKDAPPACMCSLATIFNEASFLPPIGRDATRERVPMVAPALVMAATVATGDVPLAAALDRTYSGISHANLLCSFVVRTRAGATTPRGFAVYAPFYGGRQ